MQGVKWKRLSIYILKNYRKVFYLATSDDLQGLIAQGRTVVETLEIARHVARKLIEEQKDVKLKIYMEPVKKKFDYPLVVGNYMCHPC